jgi:hypothetical protein
MAWFKVGGQLSFVTIVRAKKNDSAEVIEARALRKAWREGACYIDHSDFNQCTKDGEEIEIKN